MDPFTLSTEPPVAAVAAGYLAFAIVVGILTALAVLVGSPDVVARRRQNRRRRQRRAYVAAARHRAVAR